MTHLHVRNDSSREGRRGYTKEGRLQEGDDSYQERRIRRMMSRSVHILDTLTPRRKGSVTNAIAM